MIEDIWAGARLTSGWVILRTAPASTIGLAKSLAAAGFTAWTPVEDQRKRRPRSNDWVDRTVPMLPSFVFADAVGLPALAALAMKVEKAQPAFSVFRYAGRIPVITAASLDALRAMESKAAHRAEMERRKAMKRPDCQLPVGTAVAITDGPYQGMRGTIDRVKRKNAIVHIAGRHYVTVGAWLLRPDEAEVLQPMEGATA